MRLSIEIAEAQHQQIKALAALRGISIKDYILERTLPPASVTSDEFEALTQLEKFLAPRIEAAGRGEFSSLTMQEILAKAHSQDRTEL